MKNASRQRFADRAERLNTDRTLRHFADGMSRRRDIDRLCSDERMQRVWDLTAGLSDDAFVELMVALLITKSECQAALDVWKSAKEDCQLVDEAQVALGQSMSILQRRNADEWIWQTPDELAEEGDHLRQVKDGLVKQRTKIRESMRRLVNTRKTATAARKMFMVDAVQLMRMKFGESHPHHEGVAALTAVLFDEDDVDPDAVRAASRGARPELEWLFELIKQRRARTAFS